MSQVGVEFEGGAEQPVESTEQLIAVLTRLEKTLDTIAEATQKTGDENEEAAKKADKLIKKSETASDRFDRWQRSSQTLRTSLSAVGAGMAVVTGGAAAMTASTVALSAAGTTQEAVNDRLSASINGLGLDLEESKAIWASLQDQIAKTSQIDTDFGDEEVSDTLAKLIQLTGNYKASQEELGTVLGIQTSLGKSQEESVNIVSKAYKGNIEALQEVTPLTKEQIATLQKIKDPAERGRQALAILNAEFNGLANTTGTAGASIKDVKDVGGDLVQMLGMLINASGAVQAITGPLVELFREEEASLQNNSVAAQKFVLDMADGVVVALDVAIEVGAFFVKGMYAIGTGFEVAANSSEIFVRGVALAAEGVLYFTGEVLSFALDQLEEYLGKTADVAEALGADGIAGDLRSAADGANAFRESVDGFSDERLKGIRSQMDGIDEATDRSADAFVELQKDMESVDGVVDRLQDATGKMQANIAGARVSVKPLDTGLKSSAKSAGTIADKTAEVAKTLGGMSAEEIATRTSLLQVESSLINARATGDREEVARLERVRTRYQSELDLLGAQNKTLGLQAQQNALLQAELDYRQSMAEIKREAREQSVSRDVSALRLAALQSEDDLTRQLLEIEAERFELSYESLPDEERALRLLELQRQEQELLLDAKLEEQQVIENMLRKTAQGVDQGLNRGLEEGFALRKLELQEEINRLKEQEGELAEQEAENLERLIELEERRAESLSMTISGASALGENLAVLSTQQWDLVDGQEAYLGALGAAGQIGAGISSLLVKDRAKLAAIEAVIQTGLGIGATAAFIKSGGIAGNFAAAAAQHFSSAASMGIAAAMGGESSSGVTGVSGTVGGGASGPISRPERSEDSDRRSLTRDLADAVRQGIEGGSDATMQNYVDMRGALVLADSAQGKAAAVNYMLPELNRAGIVPAINPVRRP